MSADQTAVPAPVHTAFLLYLGAAALAVTNAVLQMSLGMSGYRIVVGAIIEAAMLLGFGAQMRAGKQWARLTMLSISGVFVGLGVLAFLALGTALGQQDNLIRLALVLVGGKIALTAVAAWKMYRPANQAYFR